MNIKEYVVGFLFDDDGGDVLLIKKNRPNWQAGRLNGVGGKIERGEGAEAAMTREGLEEAGVSPAWKYFAVIEGTTDGPNDEEWRVYCYAAFDTTLFNEAKAMTDEALYRVRVDSLFPNPLMHNLPWLIPLAKLRKERTVPAMIVRETACYKVVRRRA